MERYIDADAFDKRVRTAGGLSGGFVEEKLSDDFKEGILTVLEMLETQPTADVREVVHGEWIRSYWNGANMRYTCSRCQLSIVTNEDYIKKHRFCFACGAIMAETECQYA